MVIVLPSRLNYFVEPLQQGILRGLLDYEEERQRKELLQKRYELKKAYEDYLAQKAYEIGKRIGQSLQGKSAEEQVQELYSLFLSSSAF